MDALLTNLRGKRWAHLFVAILRILIGFAFIPAGLKKVLGQPFTDPANTGVFHEFLHAFEATGAFYHLVGAIQLICAVLLMTQTFATLGALLAIPVFATIGVFCWSTIGLTVTSVMVTLMFFGVVGLAIWDNERWRGVFLLAPRAPAPEPDIDLIDVRLWRLCGLGILVLYFAICAYSGGIYRPKGVELSNPAFWTLPLIALFPPATLIVETIRRRRRASDRATSEV